ncbi:hypothetical protein [Streptomyces canus]|uniref:hypothetical protein n=1 Tax=Streptomyces canus TaxID=58343 RepID=UPI0037218CD1
MSARARAQSSASWARGFTGLVSRAVGVRLAGQTDSTLIVVRGECPHDDSRDVLPGLENDTGTEAAGYALREAERRGARPRVLAPGRTGTRPPNCLR